MRDSQSYESRKSYNWYIEMTADELVEHMRARNARLRTQAEADARQERDRRQRSWLYNLWATIRDAIA